MARWQALCSHTCGDGCGEKAGEWTLQAAGLAIRVGMMGPRAAEYPENKNTTYFSNCCLFPLENRDN